MSTGYSYIFANDGQWKRWSGPWKNESIAGVLSACNTAEPKREFFACSQIETGTWGGLVPDYAALPQ